MSAHETQLGDGWVPMVGDRVWNPQRTLPEINPDTEPFWTGGAQGELRIHRCNSCGRLFHPPAPACHWCGGGDTGAVVVSGRGTVGGFTVVHHRWHVGFEPPYVYALIELDDDPRVRVASNVVDCEPDAVYIGMPVEVRFVADEDVWIPQFRPVQGTPR